MLKPKTARLFSLLALAMLAGGPLRAESAVEIQRLDVRRLPRIDCFFTARDDAGAYILGLSDQETTILLDGVAQTSIALESALTEGQALGVVLLFDRSGSMEDSLEEVKRAALDFVERLSVDDQVAVVSFDDEVGLETGFTADRAVVREAVSTVAPGSNTALWDALDLARELLVGASTRRKAAVVFSDGRDTRSEGDRDTVVEALRSDAIPVFAVGLAETLDEESLRALTSGTGGRFLAAAEPGDLAGVYRSIADQLENEYLATFVASSGEDESWHLLTLSVADPAGGELVASREFLASRGPGISRARLADMETTLERRDWLVAGAIGAGVGLSLGILIILLTTLVRPGIRLASAPAVGLLLCFAGLGAVLAALLLGTQ